MSDPPYIVIYIRTNRKESYMRGYVEAYEVYEASLPEGVEPDEDYFYKVFRGE